jgi:hypothetical protein
MFDQFDTNLPFDVRELHVLYLVKLTLTFMKYGISIEQCFHHRCGGY